jgi:hypothetical protein
MRIKWATAGSRGFLSGAQRLFASILILAAGTLAFPQNRQVIHRAGAPLWLHFSGDC